MCLLAFNLAGKFAFLSRQPAPFLYDPSYRQVLVALLNKPDRLDWKACMLTEEEDKEEAQAFKAAFAPFDPSG